MCYSGCIYENNQGECKHKGGPPRICPGEEESEDVYEPDYDLMLEYKMEERGRC